MGKRILLPAVAVLGGGGGIALRLWQLDAAFEPGTGLPIAGSSASIAIGLFSLLIVLGLIALSAATRGEPLRPMAYGQDFHCRNVFYLAPVWAAAVLMAVGAVLHYQSGSQFPRNYLQLAFGAFALLSALCLLFIGKNNYQGKGMDEGSLLLLMPAFGNCLWLMVSYQGWARDPFVMDYLFALFAIITSMLAHYFIAAYAFGKARPAVVCAVSMLALYFCLVSLAGFVPLAEKCLYAAQIFYLLPTIVALCRNRALPAPVQTAPCADLNTPQKEDMP